ncbi:MAG: hypothetical protein EOO12_02610 [Chitinophagaceae bacterium]|nr:MAG: hypothetical protein EOO12_02610 [Chitinophagaceae bacterium]
MNAKQEAQYNMMELVEKCLNEHDSILATLPGVQRNANRFKRLLADVRSADGRRATGNSAGPATDKETARTYLTDSLLAGGGIAKAYAVDAADETLRSRVDFTKSDLKGIRDGELPIFADNFIALADSLRAELEPYGYDDALRTDLAANLGRYRELSGAPRKVIGDRKTEGKKLKGLFTQLNILLNEQLDGLLRAQRKKHPAFLEAYETARQTIHPPTRKRSAPPA